MHPLAKEILFHQFAAIAATWFALTIKIDGTLIVMLAGFAFESLEFLAIIVWVNVLNCNNYFDDPLTRNVPIS